MAARRPAMAALSWAAGLFRIDKFHRRIPLAKLSNIIDNSYRVVNDGVMTVSRDARTQ